MLLSIFLVSAALLVVSFVVAVCLRVRVVRGFSSIQLAHYRESERMGADIVAPMAGPFYKPCLYVGAASLLTFLFSGVFGLAQYFTRGG